MAYLALYRRFRPQTFDKVIGQEHIVRILKTQVQGGQIGHAYLFCGARGTGKTSVAKIFARAINCLTPVDGSPCNKCSVCVALSSGASIDVIEMDAASNNKVEEIREIRENVQYPPVNGRYKVYIIDEVHMLTDSAFNALLKTLEEPPAHAVFILATTEVHKLPATILSRCMRFDFRLVSAERLTALISDILREIGKDFEEAAVREIARAGEGSVRDALSVADMCVSYSDGKLTYNDVLDLLSASDRGKVREVADAMLSSDTGKMLTEIDSLCGAGKAVAVLNKDIISYLRDLTVIKNCREAEKILGYPSEIIAEYKKSAESLSYNKMLRAIELLSAAETDLRYSLHPRVIFEAAMLRAANPALDGKLPIEDRLAYLENRLAQIEGGQISISRAEPKAEDGAQNIARVKETQAEENSSAKALPVAEDYPAPPPEYEPFEPTLTPAASSAKDRQRFSEPQKTFTEPQKAKAEEVKTETFTESNNNSALTQNASAMWGKVIRTLRQNNAGLLYTLCSELTAQISGGDFIIITENDMAAEILNKPKNYGVLKSIINAEKEYNVIVRKGRAPSGEREQEIEKLKELSGGKLIIKD